MPFYYNVNYNATTSGTTLTEGTQFWFHTLAQGSGTVSLDVSIKAFYASARSGSAGGGTLRLKSNTGTVASGGSAQTPTLRRTSNVAASSVWANGTSAITPGTTLSVQAAVGFAQTGGQGGWIPVEAQDAPYFATNAANPVDGELTSIAVGTSIPVDIDVEFSEGGG